jgi:hypothetical protein
MIPVICAGCRGGNDDKISTFAMTNDPAVRRAYVPSQEGQVCVLRDEHDLLAAGASEVLMNSLMTVESMNEHSERSTTTFGCAAPSWSARASTVRAEVVLAAHRHKRNARTWCATATCPTCDCSPREVESSATRGIEAPLCAIPLARPDTRAC